jgi:hypothetical protein
MLLGVARAGGGEPSRIVEAVERWFENNGRWRSMPGGIVVPPDGVVKTQLMEVFVRLVHRSRRAASVRPSDLLAGPDSGSASASRLGKKAVHH